MPHLIFQRMGWETAWCKYIQEKNRLENVRSWILHNKPIVVYQSNGKPFYYKSIWDAWNTYGLFDYKEFNNNKSGLILYYSQDSVFDEILDLLEESSWTTYSISAFKYFKTNIRDEIAHNPSTFGIP